jgi:16S rRNA (guanine527-N7)-methyltransferase
MSAQPSFRELLEDLAEEPALARLVRYAELIERWSAVHNLVKYGDRRELVERHLAEALAGRELMGSEGRLLDVGSGAGLPGVPLLALSPGWHGVLVEPRQKRWAFLRQVVRELGLDAEVVASRYQELPPAVCGFDLITARALGGFRELLRWAESRLDTAGRVMLWATSTEEEELSGLAEWRVLSSPLPGLARGRLLQLSRCFT